MDKKYWVPSLEKAHHALERISEHPGKLRLIDLSRETGIHKSSLFSLLQTMEALGWVAAEKDGTFSLGPAIAFFGNAFFKKYDIIDAFAREASETIVRLGETLQLARLEGNEILYLAKEESRCKVRLVSEPGMRLPAHATALGKMMLSALSEEQLERLFPQEPLPLLTSHTLASRQELLANLQQIKAQGFAVDSQESAVGFCCAAAPVYNASKEIDAAVSCSMPLHVWEHKSEQAIAEIVDLAARLSLIL